MVIATLGLDIAKQGFQLHGVDQRGNVVLRRRLRREQVAPFFVNLSPCPVGLEACGEAHYRASRCSLFGHTVRMIAPQFVKPHVKSNKAASNDAETIWEVVSWPQMRLRAPEVGRAAFRSFCRMSESGDLHYTSRSSKLAKLQD
jgi:transposase